MKLIGFCGGLVLATLAFSETKITREALPPAVQAAVKEQTRESDILGFATEREKGQPVYEVETKRNGKSRDLTFHANGQLLEVEEEIRWEDLPGPVQTALQKQAAGRTIRKVESVTRGTAVTYEAALQSKAGKKTEVTVNPDGTVHQD